MRSEEKRREEKRGKTRKNYIIKRPLSIDHFMKDFVRLKIVFE